MSRQTFPDNLIFANSASEIDSPNASVYSAAYESGKGKTPPKAGVHNAIFNRSDQQHQHVERNGIPKYDARTLYDINGLTLASDGGIYQSKAQGNSNHTPQSSPKYWRFVVSAAKIENMQSSISSNTAKINENRNAVIQNKNLIDNHSNQIASLNKRIDDLFLDYMKRLFPIKSAVMRSINPGLPVSQGGLGFGTWQDKAGRVPVGAGTYTDANRYTTSFGENSSTGEYRHTLTENELAPHRHYYMMDDNTGSGTYYDNKKVRMLHGGFGSDGGGSLWLYQTSESGKGEGHNNVQPCFGVKIWYRVA